MKGVQHICFKHRKCKIDIPLEYKVTFLQGKSGAGKSELTDLRYVSSSKPTVIMQPGLTDIKSLYTLDDKIVVVDEDVLRLITKTVPDGLNTLSNMVNESTAYWIFISRNPITTISYSYKAIYEVHKDSTVTRVYDDYDRRPELHNQTIYTEDTKGFPKVIRKTSSVEVRPCNGVSTLDYMLRHNKIESNSLLIADGDGCGAYAANIVDYANRGDLWLPNSFEYLLLKTSIFDDNTVVQEVLNNPVDYANEALSREKFYELFICEVMVKMGLNNRYKHDEKQNVTCFILGNKCSHRCALEPCKPYVDLRDLDFTPNRKLYKGKYEIPKIAENYTDEQLKELFGF